jgi:hypothetical protein
MARLWHVRFDERRLEQARVQLSHLGGADRGEIRRPLKPPLRSQCVAEREQHKCACEQRADERQHHQRRLPAPLAGEHPGDRVE